METSTVTGTASTPRMHAACTAYTGALIGLLPMRTHRSNVRL